MSDKLATRPKADIKKVAIASAASPTNLGVLGAGTLGSVGLIVAGMPLIGAAVLGLGALAYGSLIGLDLFNDKFIKKVYGIEDSDGAPALPPAERVPESEIVALELRGYYQAILGNEATIRATIDGSQAMLRANLEDAYQQCQLLVREAGVVARRGNRLHRYLTGVDPREIQREAGKLSSEAERTRDPKAAESFRRAAGAKQQQLATYGQIQGLYDRIKAQLSVIETSLDGIHAKLVKLNASDLEEAMSVTASIGDHVDALAMDIQVLESTVDETIKELAI